MAVGYTKHGVAITAVYPENNFAFQAFPVWGLGQVTINKIGTPLDPRHGAIVSPGTSFTINMNANYEHFVLVISTHVLS